MCHTFQLEVNWPWKGQKLFGKNLYKKKANKDILIVKENHINNYWAKTLSDFSQRNPR